MFLRIRRFVTRLILAIVFVIVVLIIVINVPFSFLIRQSSTEDYSDWMGETLESEQRVIDVAMLGAHDAFTAEIDLFSRVDEWSAASIQTGFTGVLIKGFSIRQSKTQVSTVTELLEAGVRYFDLRLTYHEEKEAWYTSHSYYSEELAPILSQMESFLAEHPGEFLLLDLQHIYGLDEQDPAAVASGFSQIRQLFADAGLMDRAYEDGEEAISEVTYGEVTADGTDAGILLFTKLPNDDPAFWPYGACIRSAWANTDDPQAAYDFLSAEATLIESGEARTGNQVPYFSATVDAREGLRVMQGVLTMQMSGEGILTALLDWSLLNKAIRFNKDLLVQDDFDEWLSAMPIIMVDYADTNYGNFLDDAMEIIIERNQNN